MNLEEAKLWLGTSYVMHPVNRVKRLTVSDHSAYADVDVRVTFERVRQRQRSFSDAMSKAWENERAIFLRKKAAA